jgi:hypothetical protein
METDDLDFGGADILDPKKKSLHDDDIDAEELVDDEDPLFLGLSEDDDIFHNAGFGDEDAY